MAKNAKMDAAKLIEIHREGAEVYHGHELCKKKSLELLKELQLPGGLLPISEAEEVGYNRSTGFVWMRNKKAFVHLFKQIRRQVSYATQVTAFVEERRMKKITGVKSKEVLIWIGVRDIYIDDPEGKKITFMSTTGISLSFPTVAFEEEKEEKEEEEEKVEKLTEAAPEGATSEKKDKQAEAK